MLFIHKSFLVTLAVSVFFQKGVDSFAPKSTGMIAAGLTKGASHISKYNTLSRVPTTTKRNLFDVFNKKDEEIALSVTDGSDEGDWVDESKKVELILLGIWGVSISAFILINNFYGPWPLFMKTIPERTFFLGHMVGGMLFGGGIILTTVRLFSYVFRSDYMKLSSYVCAILTNLQFTISLLLLFSVH